MSAFIHDLNLNRQDIKDTDFEIFHGNDANTPFLGAVVKDKSHVYLALREFLSKERPFSK
jgi:hypothetical protein